MIFKFLQKPITIDFLISEDLAHINEYWPIVPASKYIPSWWQKTPSSSFDFEKMKPTLTTKSCMGIIGSLTNGYILPLWSDLAISSSENSCTAQFSDLRSILMFHKNEESPGFYNDYHVLKIQSPWFLKSNENIKVAILDPFYLHSTPKPYIVPYGISELLNKSFPINPFLFFPKIENKIIIENNVPLIQILPITDRPTVMKTIVLSRNEYDKQYSLNNKFITSSFMKRGIYFKKFFKTRNNQNG